MSNMLRPPSLGPIVGHTTASTVRVWMRGAVADENRTVGIAALYLADKLVKGSIKPLRLQREYDRTGYVDYDGLKAETRYTVRMGSLSIDTVDPDITEYDDQKIFDSLPPLDLLEKELHELPDDEALAQVRTFPAKAAKTLSFVFGSCRYPGILWTKNRRPN